MFEHGIVILDWLGIIVFAMTGALVASRNQMDAVGFVMLGTVTGIGGGTIRDLLLDIHPILWIDQPAYLLLCAAVSLVAFFTAHLLQSRHRWILWLDAIGLALFAATGAERAISVGAHPVVAVVMGIITACFGGIIRDVLSRERSIIFSHEIYFTAALVAAATYVAANAVGLPRELALSAGIVLGFTLRGGGLLFNWSLPRYRPRGPRQP
ncbi:MAG: hypothetical protein RIT46_1353 [Pseudomonadota bacterium]|jgi:uncharacterized membrane protein YeiH